MRFYELFGILSFKLEHNSAYKIWLSGGITDKRAHTTSLIISDPYKKLQNNKKRQATNR